MALTAPKQSFNHSETQSFLSMIATFGINCMLCGNTDIDNLSIEHYTAQSKLSGDVNKGNIYPCCTKHNTKKKQTDADVFFNLYGLDNLKVNIIEGLKSSVNVDSKGIEAAVLTYVQACVNDANCFLNSLNDATIRFILLPEVRNILKGFDFSNCYIVTNSQNVAKLNSFYNLDANKVKVTK